MFELLKNRNVQFALVSKIIFLFCFHEVVNFFQTRPEINNVTTSIRHLRESLFLLGNGVDLYGTGKLQVAPWFLVFISLFEGVLNNWFGVRIFFIVLDVLIAAVLQDLLKAAEGEVSGGPFNRDELVVAYMFNPFSFFSVLGMNFSLLTLLLQLTAFLAAFKGKLKLTIALAAFLAYTDIYLMALMVPLMILHCRKGGNVTSFVIKSLAMIAGLSLTSDWIIWMNWKVYSECAFSFVSSVYLSKLRLDSLRPNSGLQWYLFTQVFPEFKNLLKITMQMTLFSFWPATSIKFRKDPLFIALVLVGSQAILKAYPSSTDYLLFFTLLTIQCKYFEYTRVLLIALFVSAGVFLFKFQIWRYWIELPGFNANFYYIFTLIWNCTLIVILLDIVSAYNKFQLFRDNPLLEKERASIKLFQK